MTLRQAAAFVFLVCFVILNLAGTGPVAAFAVPPVTPQGSQQVQFVTVEELKAKLAKNHPVTVIDVRASHDILDSDSKIKGAIYVKLRKLQSRLALPPLKNVSRDSEVVTYCACPNDEASIRAAQVLTDAGFKRVRALRGGWLAWKKSNGQIESKPRGL
ncbi:MAG: rhodanese-like domain-containing protein [Acidobacteriota bacterium]